MVIFLFHQTSMAPVILCISNFSETDVNVLQWAITRAATLQIHLTMLHVFRLPGSHDRDNILRMKQKIQADASDRFEGIEEKFFSEKNISHDFKTEIGFAYDRIHDHAKNGSIDCVVTDSSYYEKNNDCFDLVMKKLFLPVVIVP